MAQAYREFVERVRGATDIVRLIGDYIPLRKRGKSWLGLCPFHPEKTPSFSVDEQKQLFYCFGCHTGGDAFKFLMLYEKLEFNEAARLLAGKAGIEPPQFPGGSGAHRDAERDGLVAIQKEAAAFFQGMLRHPRQGERAREYLSARGLAQQTVEALGLGYAPASWDALKSHLLGKRFPAAALARSGLLASKEDGSGFYDRFRDRVMFPIVGLSGEVVAFGGRAIGEGEPKYMNSPETPLYSKGETLYGLHRSRDAIRRSGQAVVVEGYMDLATLVQAGVGHAVATLGTAFTPGQARLLARYTRRVTVNYDPDVAGLSAARRSLDLLLSRGFAVRVLRLEGGLDPDAFIRARGFEAYRSALDAAPVCIDFLLAESTRGRDLKDPASRLEALNEVLPHVAALENPAERSGYYARIAEGLGLDDDVVLEQLRSALKTGRRSVVGSPSGAARGPEAGRAGPKRVREAEARLVRGLMESEEVRAAVLSEIELEPWHAEGWETAAILEAVREACRSGLEPDVPAVMSRLPVGPDRDLLTQISYRPEEPVTAAEARSCLEALRRGRLEAERRELQKRIKEMEAAGTPVPEELLRKKMDLSRRIDPAGAGPPR